MHGRREQKIAGEHPAIFSLGDAEREAAAGGVAGQRDRGLAVIASDQPHQVDEVLVQLAHMVDVAREAVIGVAAQIRYVDAEDGVAQRLRQGVHAGALGR